MNRILKLIVVVSIIGLGLATQAPLQAQVLTNTPNLTATDQPPADVVAPTGKPIVLPRGQVTGISGPVVTVIHPEGKRKVYDPLMLTDQTEIWLGKKQVTAKSLHLKQYLRVTGTKDGDVITAERIDILTGAVKIVAKKKIVLKPKVKVTTATTR